MSTYIGIACTPKQGDARPKFEVFAEMPVLTVEGVRYWLDADGLDAEAWLRDLASVCLEAADVLQQQAEAAS